MIIQGDNDLKVPVSESRQMVDQLKNKGKAAWYIEAANEGHGFKDPWNTVYAKVAEFTFIDQLIVGTD